MVQKVFKNVMFGELKFLQLQKKFAKTLQWDFHEIKPEWVGSCDFIYTNSWDHAYDPREAFKAWCECLSTKRNSYLEHTHWHENR